MLQELVGFAAEMMALSFLSAALEHLIPSGKLKGAAMTAIGLLYIAAVFGKILGIFDRMGV